MSDDITGSSRHEPTYLVVREVPNSLHWNKASEREVPYFEVLSEGMIGPTPVWSAHPGEGAEFSDHRTAYGKALEVGGTYVSIKDIPSLEFYGGNITLEPGKDLTHGLGQGIRFN